MAIDEIYIIGGNKWINVSDRTAPNASHIYPLIDVIKCNGKEPDYDSYYSKEEINK